MRAGAETGGCEFSSHGAGQSSKTLPPLHLCSPLPRLLLKVFPTRVKLQPPPAGPAAARHLQRLQQDAADAAEEENYRAAAAAAASTGVLLPPKSSGLYAGLAGGRVLSKADWRKVLSWAVAMQTLQEKQRQLAEERQAEEREGEEVLSLLQHQAAAEAEAQADLGPEAGDGGSHTPGPGTPSGTGPRRRRRAAPSDGGQGTAATGKALACSTPGHPHASPLPSVLALPASLWQAADPLHLAAAAVELPWRLLRWAGFTAARMLSWLPLVGGLFEQQLSAAQLEAELRELEAELEQLEQAAVAAARGEGGGDASGSQGSAAGSGPSGDSGSGALCLSEGALRYGLGMLQRSSGSPKAAVEPSNRYEKRLLEEVGLAGVGWGRRLWGKPSCTLASFLKVKRRKLEPLPATPLRLLRTSAAPTHPLSLASLLPPGCLAGGVRPRLQRGRGPGRCQGSAARSGAAATEAPGAVCW